MSKFGRQPLADHLYEQRWTIAAAAERTRIPYNHLHAIVNGRCRPSAQARKELPKLLEVDLTELFDAEVLAEPYRKVRRAGRVTA